MSSQFAQLQAIAKDLIALSAYNDGAEIAELQKRARRALKTPVGNQNIGEAVKKSVEVRQATSEAFKAQVKPHIEAAKAAGRTSLRDIASYLNDHDVKPPRGTRWLASTVARAIQ